MKKPQPIPVTDHAVLRYMERVLGLDIEPVRVAIAEVAGSAARCGASAVIRDGFRYVIVDGSVITVVPVRPEPKHARHAAGGEA